MATSKILLNNKEKILNGIKLNGKVIEGCKGIKLNGKIVLSFTSAYRNDTLNWNNFKENYNAVFENHNQHDEAIYLYSRMVENTVPLWSTKYVMYTRADLLDTVGDNTGRKIIYYES